MDEEQLELGLKTDEEILAEWEAEEAALEEAERELEAQTVPD